MRHIFRAREAGAVVVSRERRGFFVLRTRGGIYGNTGGSHGDHSEYVIGRMGVPYRARGVNIISAVLDAPQDVISALSGRMGRLEGVSAKTLYSNVITPIEDR